MRMINVALPEGSQLFATKSVGCYDQFVIPSRMSPGKELYAHSRQRDEWYALMARRVRAGTEVVSEIVYDDPSCLTKLFHARIELIGSCLVVPQAQIFGGLKSIYTLRKNCPSELRTHPYLFKLGD